MPKPKPTSDASSPAPRRSFLALLTALGGVLAAAMVAIPGVGYLTAAVRRQRGEDENWVNLGPVGDYPANETRLKAFENPLAQAWDGICAKLASGCVIWGAMKNTKNASTCLPSTARTWAARWNGSRSRACSCAPATAACITKTAQRASGPPPRGLYHCVWRVQDGNLEIQAPFLPTLQNTLTGHDEV